MGLRLSRSQPGIRPWWLGPPGPQPGPIHERYQWLWLAVAGFKRHQGFEVHCGMRELLVSDHRTVRSRSRNPPQGPAPQGAHQEPNQRFRQGVLCGFIVGLRVGITLRVILYYCSTRGLVDNLDNVVISVYNKMGDGWHLKNRPSGCDISYP